MGQKPSEIKPPKEITLPEGESFTNFTKADHVGSTHGK